MNSTSIRVALYARVSTAKCEKCGRIRTEHDNHSHEFKGQDPEVQLRELREYVERRGWQVADVYTDVGVSGAKASRPDLNRLMTDAGRRRFDAVVVWRFDRFARSVSHLLRVLEQFQALGIDFVSLSENVDTITVTTQVTPSSAMQISLAIRFGRGVSCRARALPQAPSRANVLVCQRATHPRTRDHDL
jgi:DNA invertase Pin-like site-specific DNA recombinase